MSNSFLWNGSKVYGVDEPVVGAVVMKINISGVPTEDIPGYMEAVMVKLTEPRLKKQGFLHYFIPVRDEETSMTFIDFATMNSAKV